MIPGLSCGHDQELQSIEVQPANETFGATNIPVNLNAGLSVQLRALGHYIHPPVTKDITSQVTWASSDSQMITVNSAGLITATGNVCGTGTVVSATVQTNHSTSGQSSSGAIVTGNMNASVTCFTGAAAGPVLTITFLGSGSGNVTVTSASTNLTCQQSCGVPFTSGAGPITLTAATSGTFGGWGASCPSINGPVCTINTINADTDVDVTFN
jgi:hypothetical protein